jgi:hypothetical protein
MLTALASACVEDKGTAVYGAMAMLQAYNQTWVEPTNGSCHIEMQQRIAHKKVQQIEIVELPKIEKNQLLVYPSPATDKVTVYCEFENEKIVLIVKNILGELIETKSVNKQQQFVEINTSNYSSGIYMLMLMNDKNQLLSASKFVISKN